MSSSTTGGKSRSRFWRAFLGGMALVGLLFCLPLTSAGAATKKHESKNHSASHKGGAAKKSHGKSHAAHKTGHHNKSKKHKGIHARARRHGPKRHHAQVLAAKRHRFAYWRHHHHWFGSGIVGSTGVAVVGTPGDYIYTGGWRRAYWGLHAWGPGHWRRTTTVTSTSAGQTTHNTASSPQAHHTSSHQQGQGKSSGHGSSGHAAHK